MGFCNLNTCNITCVHVHGVPFWDSESSDFPNWSPKVSSPIKYMWKRSYNLLPLKPVPSTVLKFTKFVHVSCSFCFLVSLSIDGSVWSAIQVQTQGV